MDASAASPSTARGRPAKVVGVNSFIPSFPSVQLYSTRPAGKVPTNRSHGSSGLGWFRNSFDHESHNLPEPTQAETPAPCRCTLTPPNRLV
jgi:hypothetical protein